MFPLPPINPPVNAQPQRVAFQDDRQIILYSELPPLIRAEATRLAASGGQRFALLAENSCAWALADLALAHVSLVTVPLPAFFSDAQLQHILNDAGIDSILTDRPEWVRNRWPDFIPHDASSIGGLTLLQRPPNPFATNIPAGTQKITYTSGSTADPKGVCLSARALQRVTASLAAATAPLNIVRHQSFLPLSTLLENIAGVHVPLLSGATCLFSSSQRSGLSYGGVDTPRLLETISAAHAESLILAPELLQVLTCAAEHGWRPPASLKFIAVGGAAVSADALAHATELQLPAFQGYGLSECASVVCLNVPGSNRTGSVGRPLPHAHVRRAKSGELHVRGAIMSGYLGGPAIGPEWATGDLGEVDEDGFVYIQGRRRNVFITSLGRNVSPEWIERELLQNQAISHAVAVGESRPYPVALLAIRSPISPATIAGIVSRVNARLPEYARIGNWALMPQTPSFDNGLLTANGRVKRDAIAQRFGSLIDLLYDSSQPFARTAS